MEKLKLLYVDDEKANLTNFTIAFKHHFEILTAETGDDALHIFRNNDEIAVVVADQRMPGMTGVEFLQQILDINPDVTRIILTAYTEVKDIIDSINKGKIYQYIVKPWDETELLQLLKKAGKLYQLICLNKRLLNDLDRNNRQLEADIIERKRIEAILVRRDMILAAINVMANMLLLNKEWEIFAEDMICRMGMVMGVCRVNVFMGEPCGNDCIAKAKFEWVAESAKSLFADLPNQSFSLKKTGLGRWSDSLCRGESIIGNRDEFSEKEAAWLKQILVESIACIPIMLDEKCWGFISFEDCRGKRNWASPEIDVLKTAASFIGTVIKREKTDKELAVQQAQLAHAGRLTSLGEMASGMGHEIHQPLTVLNLGAEACKNYFDQHDPDCPAAEAANDMRIQVKKITKIIDSMRSFSRVSSGAWKKTNLFYPLQDSLVFFKEQFRMNMIDFSINASDQLPFVTTDSQKFEQIIVNFLSNARYAVDKKQEMDGTHEKKIELTLGYKKLSVDEIDALSFKKSLTTSNQVVVLTVKDNGIGMTEETRQKCLQPFFTTKTVGDGTGLGLSVTDRIVRELNFHLDIESREGEWTAFTVFIPVDEEDKI